jgi:fido (protein-threonine AMPylation protein)
MFNKIFPFAGSARQSDIFTGDSGLTATAAKAIKPVMKMSFAICGISIIG